MLILVDMPNGRTEAVNTNHIIRTNRMEGDITEVTLIDNHCILCENTPTELVGKERELHTQTIKTTLGG